MVSKGRIEIEVKGTDKASGVFNQIGGNLQNMSKTFQNVGIKMMGAGVLLGGGLLALAKGAADFDMAMREVNTMLDISEGKFQQLSDEVKEVSSEVGKSSTELANALYQIVSAGVASANAISVLTVAAKLAVAGVTDTATAADGLTTVLNAFKISSTKAMDVADVMFTIVRRGKTNFEELSSALFQVAPIAAAAGVKFEEVAAAIATITKQGTPVAQATTQLRAAIQGIIKPTAEMTTALKALGYESGEAMLQEEGLSGALTILSNYVDGSLEPLGKMFGSVEALGAVLSTTGENAATFADDMKATSEDAAGAVEIAYGKMNEGVGRQFEILMNDIKSAGKEIGATLLPILKDIMAKLKPIIDGFAEWISTHEDLFPKLLKLVGILLGVGISIFAAAKAVAAVNIALAIFHGLSGPAGWIKLALGAAAATAAIIAMNEAMGEFSFDESAGQTAFNTELQNLRDMGYTDAQIEEILGKPLPEMQYGGVVPGPIGMPVPIIAHGGEEFAGVGNSMGGSTNINVGTLLGDEASLRKFARMVKNIVGEDNRRNSFGQLNKGYYFGRSSI